MCEEIEERWRETSPLWNATLQGECFALVSFDLGVSCAVCDVTGNDTNELWMEISLEEFVFEPIVPCFVEGFKDVPGDNGEFPTIYLVVVDGFVDCG